MHTNPGAYFSQYLQGSWNYDSWANIEDFGWEVNNEFQFTQQTFIKSYGLQ